MKIVLNILILSLISISCNNHEENTHQPTEKVIASLTELPQSGKRLMEQKCYVCHSSSANMQERIAPPMIAVKKHYLNDEVTIEEFSETLWNWVEKPSEENSKMKGAVRRFGVMPYQQFKKEEIEAIAYYMFYNDIEEPEWFEDHFKQKQKGRN